MTDSAILAQNVVKTFKGGIRALDDLSLDVKRGEIFGLLGRNGAGKTTLIKILLDIVRPTSGYAAILDVTHRSTGARKSIGYLPEDHRFPEYRTAEQTLDFYARLSGTPGTQRREMIGEYLKDVGLEGARRRKVRTFSKGMKQRLGLAQAMIHEPDVIFLDEPTDGVDPEGRAEIRKVLIDLKQRGKTIFLNSHLLGEVEQICDRVAIIDRGRLKRIGPVHELTSVGGVYSVVVNAPVDAETWENISPVVVNVANDRRSFDIGVRDESQLDDVIGRLASRGYKLRQLMAKKLTLEDVFLSVIEREQGARK